MIAVHPLIVSAVLPITPIFAVTAPDNQLPPYAIYTLGKSGAMLTLNSGNPADNDLLKVTVYQTGYSATRDLAKAVRDALVALAYPISVIFKIQSEGFNTQLRFFEATLEFSVWQPRVP